MNDLLLSYSALGVGSFVLCFLLAWVANRLGRETGASWGFRRKLLHVGVFSGAVPAHLWLGFWGVCIYGAVITSYMSVSLRKGESSLLSRVLARRGETGPEISQLFVPMAATGVGGLSAALLVGPFAVVGYLVCGWGSGSGEVVGRLIGRKSYRPPISRGSGSVKTLEGSIAVLFGGFLGGWAALGLLGFPPIPAAGTGLAAGVVGAMAEGLSGGNAENFWVQLLPSLAAWWILG